MVAPAATRRKRGPSQSLLDGLFRLRTGLHFWIVLLEPGLDLLAPRGPWPEFEGPRVHVVVTCFGSRSGETRIQNNLDVQTQFRR
jgi:hypothetical protein